MILRQVRSELWMQSVDVRGFTAQHLQAFLPRETNTEDHFRIYIYINSFMKEPLLVSDSDLQSILRCKPSLQSDPRIKHATICYYRSWPITREQLHDILARLAEQGFFSKRTQHWTIICRIARPGQVIAIRYIGRTAYPSSRTNDFTKTSKKVEARCSSAFSCPPSSLCERMFILIERLDDKMAFDRRQP